MSRWQAIMSDLDDALKWLKVEEPLTEAKAATRIRLAREAVERAKRRLDDCSVSSLPTPEEGEPAHD